MDFDYFFSKETVFETRNRPHFFYLSSGASPQVSDK